MSDNFHPGPAAALPSPVVLAAILIGFSLFYGVSGYSSLVQKSATFDEMVHISSGYVALTQDDYRVDHFHPPLWRMILALPLLFDDAIVVNTEGKAWTEESYWFWCHRFFFEDNDAQGLLRPARLINLVSAIALGWFLFFWCTQLFGWRLGALVLGLYALEPTIMAHARLATTDLGATWCFVLVLFFLRRFCQWRSIYNLGGLVVSLGLALTVKLSILAIVPAILLVLCGRIYRSETWQGVFGTEILRRGLPGKLCFGCGGVLFGVLVWLTVVWAVYGFRFAISPMGDASHTTVLLERVLQSQSSFFMVINELRQAGWVPDAYGRAFLESLLYTGEGRSSYLLGSAGQGAWYYFPFALLIKLPLSLWLLLLVALLPLLSQRTWRQHPWNFVICAGVPIFYLLVLCTADLQIGVRHALPLLPLMFFWLAWGLAQGQVFWRRKSVLALALLAVLEFGWAYPDFLQYFSPIVGGASQGHHYLVDSNLDWGQDLKALKSWMDEEGVEHINLSYFGTAKPEYYGISATHLRGQSSVFTPAGKIGERPKLPGWIAISVTNLKQELPAFYSGMREKEPDAKIKETIWLYYWDPAKDQK